MIFFYFQKNKSGLNTVVLNNVSRASSGTYKCEVIVMGTFEKVTKEKEMGVLGTNISKMFLLKVKSKKTWNMK